MQKDITPKRAHIYEVDFLRALTVFSVVTLHSLSSLTFLIKSPVSSVQLINFFIHSLHYNREMFIFVTGFLLTYSYFNKPFSAKKFWLRRFLLIVVPYIFWSLIYVTIGNTSLGIVDYIKISVIDILTGNASYQLYYILLTIQFYAIFPLVLMILKYIKTKPLVTILISFAIQIVGIGINYSFIQTGILHGSFISNFLIPYQDRLFITYQFFFIAGAFIALYIENVYTFIGEYGRYLPYIFIANVVCFALYFNYQIHIAHSSLNYAVSVLQPSVVIYSAIIIIFFGWLAILWAKRKKLFGVIKLISETSFGIFFVHVFILNIIVHSVLPVISSSTPIVLKMLFVIISTFLCSIFLCWILLKTSLLSWTIGRGKKR